MMDVTMDQVRELADRYVECGLGDTSSGRFLQSIARDGIMPRGRGINWLNDLITKGSPQTVEPLIEEIKGLISRSDRDDTKVVLSQILTKVKAGWALTDHKKSELERLRKQVNDGKPDLVLDERQRQLMVGLAHRKRFHSLYYWAGRPAISLRLDDIFHRWSTRQAVSPDDWEYIRDNFKGQVSEFEGGRHPPGTLRWTRSGTPVTIMGEPGFDDRGDVIIEVLTPEGTLRINAAGLLIRKPR